jgi:hypothetical protein
MITLLVMPIVIKRMITRGVIIQLAAAMVVTLALGRIAKGDLCALTWLPFMAMCALGHCNRPEPLPPEKTEYILQKRRLEKGNWLSSNIPNTWKAAWNAYTAWVPSKTRKGRLGSHHCPHQYQRDSPSRGRQTNRAKNRAGTMAMKLVTVSCFAASALGEQIRFDLDSKPIAIDNCLFRCLTNSRSDFMPGTTTKCNVAILGVGG